MDAEVFREMRFRLQMSQTQLAKALGVHPVTVNKWEHGARPITRVVELAMWGLIMFDERDPRRRATRSGDAP